MRWKRLTNQILTENFNLGGLIMGAEPVDNIIKDLSLGEIFGELEYLSISWGVEIITVIKYLIRVGVKMETARLELLCFPPHTPPFKNKINIKNTEGILNKLNTNNLTKSHPIVSGKSPLEKKAARKAHGRKKNKVSMPKLWVDAREAGAIHDEVLIDYGEKQGYDWYATKELFLHFVDHHLAKGSKFVKWHNAFYMWVRNDAKFNGPPAKKNSGVLQSFETKNTLEDMFNDR
jgi:hypothetical protein